MSLISALPALCSVPSIPSPHCLVGTGLIMLSLLEAERGSPHFPSPVSGNRQASNTAFQFLVFGDSWVSWELARGPAGMRGHRSPR